MSGNRSPYEPERRGRPVRATVRAAVPADAHAIARVDEARGKGPAGSLEPLVRRSLNRIARGQLRRYVCVALIEDEVVGYATCTFLEWSPAEGDPALPDGWYLTGVEVIRRHRRRGVGRALTEQRLDWLRDRTDVVHYFTGEGNHPSRDLHAALGFEEVMRGVIVPLPPPFSNEEPHILGRKILVPRRPSPA